MFVCDLYWNNRVKFSSIELPFVPYVGMIIYLGMDGHVNITQVIWNYVGFSGLHSVSRSWADHTSWCRFKNEHHAWFRSGGWSASWSCRTLWSWKPSPECEIVLYTYGYIFALNWALIMSRKSPINVKRW